MVYTNKPDLTQKLEKLTIPKIVSNQTLEPKLFVLYHGIGFKILSQSQNIQTQQVVPHTYFPKQNIYKIIASKNIFFILL